MKQNQQQQQVTVNHLLGEEGKLLQLREKRKKIMLFSSAGKVKNDSRYYRRQLSRVTCQAVDEKTINKATVVTTRLC